MDRFATLCVMENIRDVFNDTRYQEDTYQIDQPRRYSTREIIPCRVGTYINISFSM